MPGSGFAKLGLYGVVVESFIGVSYRHADHMSSYIVTAVCFAIIEADCKTPCQYTE
jgi:hypothetical protein